MGKKEWEMSRWGEFKYRLHNAVGRTIISIIVFIMIIFKGSW
jgi:hypothetical protein